VAGLLAVNLAILLTGRAADLAVRYNARLLQWHPGGFRFGPTCLPHITLVQQFIDSDAVDDVSAAIGEDLDSIDSFTVRSSGLGPGGSTVHVRIDARDSIVDLHVRMLERMGRFALPGGGAAAFENDDGRARPGDVGWVAGFRDMSSREHFAPHVTLGVGNETSVGPVDPFDVRVERLGLCRLGSHGTCRRILSEWRLAP
jgi:2'-5' RNA ligase